MTVKPVEIRILIPDLSQGFLPVIIGYGLSRLVITFDPFPQRKVPQIIFVVPRTKPGCDERRMRYRLSTAILILAFSREKIGIFSRSETNNQ